MADPKKPAPAAPAKGNMEEVIFFLGGLLLLAAILNQISLYLGSGEWDSRVSQWSLFLNTYFWPFWSFWKVMAILLSLACVAWAVYSSRKLGEIDKEEKKLYGPVPDESVLEELMEKKEEEKKNEKWLRVVEHAHSESPGDWRLAIMEADVMLEELLHTLGYHGDTVGEMLKSADDGDFINLEAAWEAHKVRNRIAHGGADLELNQRETRRAVALFETVFRECGII